MMILDKLFARLTSRVLNKFYVEGINEIYLEI